MNKFLTSLILSAAGCFALNAADKASTYMYVGVGGTSTKYLVSEVDSVWFSTDAADGGSEEEVDPYPGTWRSTALPSLYETYKKHFDYFGIAATYGNFGLKQEGDDKYTATYSQQYWGTPGELYYDEIQQGIAKHANSITLGNEMKPQFLLAWWSVGSGGSVTTVDFTASNGKTIKVPAALPNEKLLYATMNVAKKMGVQIRGHVLTWHSQTPDDFFAEGYSASVGSDGLLTNAVDAETMTARHEWYIKTVLECVANWEAANGYGEGNHIIWVWDVVNEACADDATTSLPYRGQTTNTASKSPSSGGSRWYQIYNSNEFIINAFRFANAYAPADVKLAYNDYNEYMDYSGGWKTTAIETLVKDVQNGAEGKVNGKSVKPRIDVIGMQSHLGTSWPGTTSYENAIKRFLALNCDINVTELDFSAKSQDEAVTAYTNYFTLFKKYGKSYSGDHKITSVTIWGINNESSWINPSSSGGSKTYPLLFNIVDNVTTSKNTVTYDTGTEDLPVYDKGDTYKPNASFDAVIKVAE
jgi:GH35 family endo-1,4-beta-xylanase